MLRGRRLLGRTNPVVERERPFDARSSSLPRWGAEPRRPCSLSLATASSPSSGPLNTFGSCPIGTLRAVQPSITAKRVITFLRAPLNQSSDYPSSKTVRAFLRHRLRGPLRLRAQPQGPGVHEPARAHVWQGHHDQNAGHGPKVCLGIGSPSSACLPARFARFQPPLMSKREPVHRPHRYVIALVFVATAETLLRTAALRPKSIRPATFERGARTLENSLAQTGPVICGTHRARIPRWLLFTASLWGRSSVAAQRVLQDQRRSRA